MVQAQPSWQGQAAQPQDIVGTIMVDTLPQHIPSSLTPGASQPDRTVRPVLPHALLSGTRRLSALLLHTYCVCHHCAGAGHWLPSNLAFEQLCKLASRMDLTPVFDPSTAWLIIISYHLCICIYLYLDLYVSEPSSAGLKGWCQCGWP